MWKSYLNIIVLVCLAVAGGQSTASAAVELGINDAIQSVAEIAESEVPLNCPRVEVLDSDCVTPSVNAERICLVCTNSVPRNFFTPLPCGHCEIRRGENSEGLPSEFEVIPIST